MIIKPEDTTDEIINFFTVKNPKYYNLLKLDKFTGYTSRIMNIGSKNRLPPGTAYWHAKKYGVRMNLNDLKFAKQNTSISLRDNQPELFFKIYDKRACLVEASTGFGKSVIITALSEVWGGKTLIISNSRDNVKYFYDTFKKFLGIDVGMYYSDKKDMQDITVSTFMTCVKNKKLFYDMKFNNLIIDEADEGFTEKRRDFICNFKGDRVFGLTATTKTKPDNYLGKRDVKCLNRFYGYTVKIDTDYSKIPLKDIKFFRYNNNYCDNVGGLSIRISPTDWQEYRKNLDKDMERKKLQAKYLIDNATDKEHSLILFDRVADVELFHKSFKNKNKKCYIIHGKIKKKEREKAKSDFLKKGGYLFAQTRTTGRGTDLPECSKLFIFYPVVGENALRQIVGRITRYIEGKKSYVYDWLDSGLEFQFNKRKKIYQEFFNITPKEI